MGDQREEIADLIVQGKNREAYEKMIDEWPHIGAWDARERRIAARNVAVPPGQYDQMIARHKSMIAGMFPKPKPGNPRA